MKGPGSIRMLAHLIPKTLSGDAKGVGRLGNVPLVLQQCRADERVFARCHVAIERSVHIH